MKRGVLFAVTFILPASLYLWRQSSSALSEEMVSSSRLEAKKIESLPQPSFAKELPSTPSPQEDADILAFAAGFAANPISEGLAIKLLQSNLSENKKAVVLEFYSEQGGSYRNKAWPQLLLSLLLGSEQWPELANKAALALAPLNSAGQWDVKILEALDQLPRSELVKRTALAYSLGSRPSIEKALAEAEHDVERETLARKHARFLTQKDRLLYFEANDSELLRSQYLELYIKEAKDPSQLNFGLYRGVDDPKLSSARKQNFLLAASDSTLPGKSQMLFDYWQRVLPEAKKNEAFMAFFNLAIQKAVYSESEPAYASGVVDWLLAQSSFDANNLQDPSIDLAIAMVNACIDPLIEKRLCPILAAKLALLKDKLIRDGLESYVLE